MRGSRAFRLTGRLLRLLVYVVAAICIVIALALLAIETGWAKGRLRGVIVSQANRYLTATLEIDQLEGSLFRGVQLAGVRLSRYGQPIVTIERVEVSYSIRELIEGGTLIRRLRLVKPHIVAARQPDGRWNLAALVRREARQAQRTGPGRPIDIQRIEIVDGTVRLANPLAFGAANVPTDFRRLNTTFAFRYRPVRWELDFEDAAFVGRAPDLTVRRLSGRLGNGSAGWTFENLFVDTPRSTFTLTGRVRRDVQPTTLDLHVDARRFAFQEWGRVLRGIRNIAIESSFDVTLKGPLAKLGTTLALQSNGGNIDGTFELNSSVPGWRGAGVVDVARLDLAPWLNRPDRPSDISGRIRFDLDLQLGRGFPRGRYDFDGSHAAFMGYEADDVRARGVLTPQEAVIAAATATAYAASVRIDDGAIGISAPYNYRFRGVAAGVDLRRVPATIPVPHVESELTFAYDVAGRFTSPFITGRATFEPSTFLGAAIGAGTVGAIDTADPPFRYSGEGDISDIDLNAFGRGLGVLWLQDPRYRGIVSGHFFVDGRGSQAATMALRGGGRLTRATLFGGVLSDADVSIDIGGGDLRGSYNGHLTDINPAIAFGDARYDASLTGTGRGSVAVPGLLLRSPTLNDYTVDAQFALTDSVLRAIRVTSAETTARLAGGSLTFDQLTVRSAGLDGSATGVLELDGARSSRIAYDVRALDLAQWREQIGDGFAGRLTTKGQLTGPYAALHAEGSAAINSLEARGVSAATTVVDYDVTFPADRPSSAAARIKARATFVEAFGTALRQAAGTIAFAENRAEFALDLSRPQGADVSVTGVARLHPDRQAADVERLTVFTGQTTAWRMLEGREPATLSWDQDGFAVSAVTFVDVASGRQRLGASGSWRRDGQGSLRITAAGVYLDTLAGAVDRPARYGGVLDADVTVQGTLQRPILIGDFTVSEGRIRRLSYDRLSGRIGYTTDLFEVNVRLDQSPGVWLTAVGSIPMAVFDPKVADRPMHLSVLSSAISLTLLEGVTDVVRDVTGEMRLDLTALGTGRDPQFAGSIEMSNAAFLVPSSGARYRNGRAAIQLSADRITVTDLHLEDRERHALDIKGSLGTERLRVGAVDIQIAARDFEVLRNELGTVEIHAGLSVVGDFQSPRIAGEVTIASGALQVERILDRTLFRPYATEPQPEAAAGTAPIAELDAIAALNPWERLGLDIFLRTPGSLRLIGEDVQVAPGTPLGLGSFNLRVLGDLYLYKDPGQPLYINGSFDRVTGTYAFQGRRFDVDPTSSINFRGDLNPELFVLVRRVISEVETRVTIAGPLREPALQLTSTPPLEPTDILSLIVFNTQVNELTNEQQQQLAVRAGTLAAGFLATPLLSAIERTLGIDILEIEAVDSGQTTGTRVTIGDEIAPGLVARFTRQFGTDEYDEATVEYYISRLFRIRATFSDAGSAVRRSLFRRVERAGIDFLVFFSF